MAFSFNQLNLESVNAAAAADTLKPGRYQCKVAKAEVKQTKTGGSQLEVTLVDLGGQGSIRAWINVHVPSSAEATRIGREQLKGLLLFGGHKTPDHPGDVRTIVGLKPGVAVGTDDYEKDGETRKGSKVRGFFDPKEITGSSSPSNSQSGGNSGGISAPPGMGLDDEIPF
jgi:hypothetical protein